ncbi:PD-(D/E)XK nuclease family protein [Haloprofundus salinisoli]|uniref:PD-(D/E)XK nuclease family protein n=1 Tax=Haloprofundus salinisoli TaxID=2876193 RepID=UPI001CCD9087|nr:PD-(D/E)XK nuclease family protein [Haloprofundus salinisoli]
MTEFDMTDAQIAVIDSSNYRSFETPFQHAVCDLLTGEAAGVSTPVSPEDILVVVRTNDRAKDCLEALLSLGIPAYRVGDRGLKGTVGGAVLDLLELATALRRHDEPVGCLEEDSAIRIKDCNASHITNSNSIDDQAAGIANILTVLYGIPKDPTNAIRDGTLDSMKRPYEYIKEDIATGQAILPDSAIDMDPMDVRKRVTAFLADVETIASEAAHQSLVGASGRTVEYLGLDSISTEIPSLNALQQATELTGVDDNAAQCSVTAIRNVRTFATVPASQVGVRISTIHKAKGSEAPVVVMPDLTSADWPVWHSKEQLEHVARGLRRFTDTAEQSVAARRINNQRRLAYVGITRPRDLLVMIGHSTGSTAPSQLLPDVDPYLNDALETSTASADFDIWTELQSVLPSGTKTWQPPDSEPSDLSVRGEGVSTETEALIATIQETRTAAETTDPEVDVTALDRTRSKPRSLDRSYSFTAVSAGANCERRALLEGVLEAPGIDDSSSSSTATDGPSPRTVGILTHAVAEHEWPQSQDLADWLDRLDAVATSHKHQDTETIEAVEQRIRILFDMDGNEWPVVATEVPFKVVLGGREIVGSIDAVERTSEGIRPIDLKTGAKEPDHLQLAIYQLALCKDETLQQRWPDATVLPGEFLQVHPDNVGVSTYERASRGESLAKTSATHARPYVETLATVSFDNYTPGDHCAGCPYSYLGCGPVTDEGGDQL